MGNKDETASTLSENERRVIGYWYTFETQLFILNWAIEEIRKSQPILQPARPTDERPS